MEKAKKIITRALLVLMMVTTIGVPTRVEASSNIKYYQTVKNSVPIWSSASSKSTKKRTIGSTGTVLKVVDSKKNSAGNLWYKLEDGNWVYSGNVKAHSHSYSGGRCTAVGCGYEYPLELKQITAKQYTVIKDGGAPIWDRPYSNNTNLLRRAPKGSTVTLTHKVTNKAGNLWYKLSDGGYIYSGNVELKKIMYTLTLNNNGGEGPNTPISCEEGKKVKIPSVKTSKVGYVLSGWADSKKATKPKYKTGSEIKLNSDMKLYAVWTECKHPKYASGVCTTCKYEYKLKVKKLNNTEYTVTKKDSAPVWNKPYSDSTQVYRKNKGEKVIVNGSVKNAQGNLWYRLDDGNWIYSGNVTNKVQVVLSYDANGGSGAPGKQNTYAGETVYISSSIPKREGYLFLGWDPSAKASKPKYTSGSSFKIDGNMTLYAIWTKVYSNLNDITYADNAIVDVLKGGKVEKKKNGGQEYFVVTKDKKSVYILASAFNQKVDNKKNNAALNDVCTRLGEAASLKKSKSEDYYKHSFSQYDLYPTGYHETHHRWTITHFYIGAASETEYGRVTVKKIEDINLDYVEYQALPMNGGLNMPSSKAPELYINTDNTSEYIPQIIVDTNNDADAYFNWVDFEVKGLGKQKEVSISDCIEIAGKVYSMIEDVFTSNPIKGAYKILKDFMSIHDTAEKLSEKKSEEHSFDTIYFDSDNDTNAQTCGNNSCVLLSMVKLKSPVKLYEKSDYIEMDYALIRLDTSKPINISINF